MASDNAWGPWALVRLAEGVCFMHVPSQIWQSGVWVHRLASEGRMTLAHVGDQGAICRTPRFIWIQAPRMEDEVAPYCIWMPSEDGSHKIKWLLPLSFCFSLVLGENDKSLATWWCCGGAASLVQGPKPRTTAGLRCRRGTRLWWSMGLMWLVAISSSQTEWASPPQQLWGLVVHLCIDDEVKWLGKMSAQLSSFNSFAWTTNNSL
jgi:hypothetical protein